jgi:anti-sigma B factor antagonist
MEPDLGSGPASAVITVRAEDELDVYNAASFRHELVKAGEERPRILIVDLTQTVFMDNTALGVILSAHLRAEQAGYHLGVVCDREPILRMFRLTGLSKVLRIKPAADALIAGLGR